MDTLDEIESLPWFRAEVRRLREQTERIAGYEAVYRDLVNRCSECPWRHELLKALE